MDVVETLKAEHAELTTKLSEMDERIRTERPGLVAQIAQLHRAIVTLTKPAPIPGTRKPMSEEGKAAIKAGLEKARAAKLAGTTGTKPETTAPAVALPAKVAGAEASPAKKPVAADKGSNRGA